MTRLPWWRSLRMAAALAAGPVVWAVFWLSGVPVNANWPPLGPWLLMTLVYPVLEEFVFRGGMQAALMERRWFAVSWRGISRANAATSVVFALAHLLGQSLFWSSMVFFPSLIFGWARDRFNSVLPSMVLHAFYNAGFVGLYVTLPSG